MLLSPLQLQNFLNQADKVEFEFDTDTESSESKDTSGNTVIDYTNVKGLSSKVRPKLESDTSDVDTWYLPWKESTATFLRLVSRPLPGGRNWFFTAKLTGCEMWIVSCSGQPPIVMHVNALGDVYFPIEKVTLEVCSVVAAQTLAATALQTVQTTYGASCRFVHRITRGDPKQQHDLDIFCGAHMTIAVSTYDGTSRGGARFYGYYGVPTGDQYSVQYDGWTFRVRIESVKTEKVKVGFMGMFGSEETRKLYPFSPLTSKFCNTVYHRAGYFHRCKFAQFSHIDHRRNIHGF